MCSWSLPGRAVSNLAHEHRVRHSYPCLPSPPPRWPPVLLAETVFRETHTPRLWCAPSELEGFGLGVVLYFKTLVIMGCLMAVCFAMNLWTIGYFSSDKYSGGYQQKSNVVAMFPQDLVGSALCPAERQHNFTLTNGQRADLHLCPFNATQVWLQSSAKSQNLVPLVV